MVSNVGIDLMATVGSLNEVVGSLRTTLAAIRRRAQLGTLDNAEVMAVIDEAIGSDEEDSKRENVAAERHQPLMLVAERGGLPIPGDFVEVLDQPAIRQPLTMEDFVPGDHGVAETPAEKLVKLLEPPVRGLSPGAEALLAEAQGADVRMIGGLPEPRHPAISLEGVRDALVVAKGGRRAQKFSGEMAGGLAVPD